MKNIVKLFVLQGCAYTVRCTKNSGGSVSVGRLNESVVAHTRDDGIQVGGEGLWTDNWRYYYQAKAKQASAAMDGVIKIVQGCSGSTSVPHVPRQINEGFCTG